VEILTQNNSDKIFALIKVEATQGNGLGEELVCAKSEEIFPFFIALILGIGTIVESTA
jgi:hypothetical protein